MIIIVGAGLAGLTCAKVLREAGRDVVVVEASDGVGGRVRSDMRDGYMLDRGFQVLLTAYPAVRRHLDLPALRPQAFQPGAAIARDGKLYDITDPTRDRNLGHIAATVMNPLLSLNDKARVLALRADMARRSVAQIFGTPESGDSTITEELLARGFSQEGFISKWIRSQTATLA
jgi:phytoene dehydrogenase-like protein